MKKTVVVLALGLFLLGMGTAPQHASAGAEPFIGEIVLFAGNFAPQGWAFCEGQLLSIVQNPALFSILGTTYGGDGRTTFALPDLRGRVPLGPGAGPGLTSRQLGDRGGAEVVVLDADEMPVHNHAARGGTELADSRTPDGTLMATMQRTQIYTENTSTVPMNDAVIGDAGAGQPHNNMPPYLGMHYIIAIQGLFPSRN